MPGPALPGTLVSFGISVPGADAVRDVVLAQLDILAAASGGAMHAVSPEAVDPFVARFSIFVLGVFIGYFVVWSVTPALHTPLMSVTNAISSVIVVGALLAVGVRLIPGDSG
ncbi:MAG TPA: proton-translocating transhydrogenase family protein, partial [Xanthobacteraceae bacterium]